MSQRSPRSRFWRSATLRTIATIFLPLTLLSVVIAVASVLYHQWEMRRHLTAEALRIATDPALEFTLFAPLALIPPLLFAAAALWFAARRIVQPLQQLEEKAAALAWGDFEAIKESVGGISEIRHLQNELAEMSRKVRAAQEGLHDYIGAITSAQEEERNRLARELHDDTIQAVIALKQRVQFAQKSIKDQNGRQSLKELETLAEQTIENLRRLTRALRPIYLEDLGLVTALEMLAREISQSNPLTVEFQKTGMERRLSPETELSLYRIAQEALNNVVKHSGATRANLSIRYTDSETILVVTDNGNGFVAPASPTEFAFNGHFGLLGIYERADLIGARLAIESVLGKGARLEVRL